MKVLITADIHLGNYSDFNYNANSRLDQFDLLSHRLVELGKQNGCTECWILGDFLRVPNIKSRIHHRLKRFLHVLCDGFSTVRYVLGQHDLDAKSDNQDIEDTIVSISELDNFIYMDKQVMKLDNHEFAFMNWTPSQDLSWLESEKVDILLGHYTKSELFGQDIDDTRFNLMIHGDIHNDQVLGKFVSVGNPIQHDYSSQAEGTCIVLDTSTLEWNHIKVDDSHTRFLRLFYTDDPALEGFKGPLEYYKYKPRLSNETSDVNQPTIEWKDIDDLCKQVIQKYDLLDIHDEISQSVTGNTSIDFNIQLISLDIKGYRSVVDFHIDFDENERLVLLGDNGSGKSSIMNAMKSAFEKSRYMYNEKSDLCDTQLITVKFMYQNKLIELTKGDTYRLVIDGDEQKYNNKTEFENDVINRFPFINYIDIFFIASNSSNLTSQLSPARCIELISKFYRLDSLEEYSKLGFARYEELRRDINDKKVELNELTGSLNLVNSRLSELEDIDIDGLDGLNEKLDSYAKLRTQHSELKEWEIKHSGIISRYNEVSKLIDSYKARLVINPDTTKERINELKRNIDKLTELQETSVQRCNLYAELTKIFNEKLALGMELSKKISELKSSKCPECGHPLSESKSAELLSTYNKRINEVRAEYDDAESKLNEFKPEEKKEKYFVTLLSNIKTNLKNNNDELILLNNKLSQYELAKDELNNVEARLQSIQLELDESNRNKPTNIVLPINLSEIEDDIRSQIYKIKDKLKELKQKVEIEECVSALESIISMMNKNAMRYCDYGNLMSKTGEILEEILKQLANKFSNNEIKYVVNAGVYRNNRFIEFNIYYKVKNKWRIYNSLSSGQKQICDLDFLNKLFSTKIGFLVLDEYLRHLDEKNFPKGVDLLMSMNVNTLILSTHDPNISIYTKRILLELDETGATRSKII